MRHIALIALLLTVPHWVTAAPGNWARFRGPGGKGSSSTAADTLTHWSESENLQWKTPLPGPGSSSPIVWERRVFVTCYSGYGAQTGGAKDDLRRHLVCIDRESGDIVWTKTVVGGTPEDDYQGYLTEHGYASNTSVTDGERVYAFFGKSGVFAFDFDGQQLW